MVPAEKREQGRRRQQLRLQAGFKSAEAFAKKIGWHRTTVAHVERGGFQPKPWYDWLLQMAVDQTESNHAPDHCDDTTGPSNPRQSE